MINFDRCYVCFAAGGHLHGVGHPTLGMMVLCKPCYKLWVKGDIEALDKRDVRPHQLGLGLRSA